jgi:hypothetical protein
MPVGRIGAGDGEDVDVGGVRGGDPSGAIVEDEVAGVGTHYQRDAQGAPTM